MNDVLQQIKSVGIMPVVRATSAENALRVVDAIRAGGIPILEITLTVPGAVQIIADLAKRLGGEALIGAGTVLDADSARACVDAGARFIVTPALDIPTIDACRKLDVPIFAGALTPTEILTAWKAGANVVKVFPAGAVGGATYIKSVKAPLPQIELVPTGGVSLKNAADFIAAGAFALGVGADLVSGTPAEITEKAKQYAAAVTQARA